MAFWTRIFGDREPPPDPDYNPGDPEGVEFTGEPVGEYRNFPAVYPSPWSGWPDEWGAPGWEANGRYNRMFGINRLIDVAWAAIDLNASVLAAMPLYRLQSGEIIDNLPWMTKPDDIYASWQECAKQIFWDFQLAGEVFILPMSTYADGFPKSFRVVPPWLISVEMIGGHREYRLGANDVTDEILHIRYQSSTDDAHGHSPLEMAGARMVTAGLLTRYTNKLAETGGTPHYWINVEKHLNKEQADDLLDQWVESRVRRAGEPALLTGGAGLNQMQSMNAKDMTLLELQTFSEARISVLLGVPPFLIGLPMAQGESITYSNASTLFDFHDRSSLRPKATAVMQALSNWALPRGQSLELNRDDYSRPGYLERAQANQIYVQTGVLRSDEVRAAERFYGPAAAVSLTGGLPGSQQPTSAPPPPTLNGQPAGRPPPEPAAARATAQGLVAERAGHGGGNPYHDELGKFTTKGGAGSGGTKTAHTTISRPFGEINMTHYLPPGPIKRIIGAYNRIKAKYPQLRVGNVRVGDITGTALAETWTRPPSGPEIAETSRGDNFIEIVLNESLADVVATGKAYADSVSTGFHPPAGPNNDCYDAIMIHELGHALTDKTNAVSRVEGELLKAFNEYNASASEENAYESFENWVYDNVSGYALDGNGRLNPAEALADAFEDVEMNGHLAKPGSKALHRMLEEELRRAAK